MGNLKTEIWAEISEIFQLSGEHKFEHFHFLFEYFHLLFSPFHFFLRSANRTFLAANVSPRNLSFEQPTVPTRRRTGVSTVTRNTFENSFGTSASGASPSRFRTEEPKPDPKLLPCSYYFLIKKKGPARKLVSFTRETCEIKVTLSCTDCKSVDSINTKITETIMTNRELGPLVKSAGITQFALYRGKNDARVLSGNNDVTSKFCLLRMTFCKISPVRGQVKNVCSAF